MMHRRKRRVTVSGDALLAIRRDYEAGNAIAEIALAHNVARSTIEARALGGRWDATLAAANRQARLAAGRREAMSVARQLFESGAPMADVLAIARRCDSAVREHAARGGWDVEARRSAIAARINTDTPRCGTCGELKPRSEFYTRRHSRNGQPTRDSRCKACSRLRARMNDWKAIDGSLTMADVGAIFAAAKCCAYCNRPLRSREKTLDHVIPRSRGGDHSRENVAVACRFCNTSKGARTLLEWVMARVESREVAA